MVNVTVSTSGTSGPRGPGWVSGAGAPSNSVGFNGDFYLDTTNVGIYYGPKTAGVWGSSHPFSGPLTNFSATTAPTVNNDNTQGYSRGSVWINTTTNTYYVATSVATGAAAWQQTINVGTTASGDLSGTYPNPTVSRMNGVSMSATAPVAGQIPTATGSTAMRWSVTPGAYSGTGVIYGCLMTANTATSFNVSAGQAVIVDYTTDPANPTASLVTINAQTVTLNGTELARVANWWTADVNGVITSQATRPQHGERRTKIQIGVTEQASNVIVDVTPSVIYTPQGNTQLYDLLYDLGPFNEPLSSSNAISANGANLSMNKTAGSIFTPASGYQNGANNQHYVISPAETPVSFFKVLRNTTTLPATVTVLDPTNYDNNGVLTPVGGGAGSATIQRVFLVPTGVAAKQVYVQYGQTVYSSLTNAINAVGNTGFVTNPLLDGVAAAIYWVVMTRTCTSLLDTANASIRRTGRFALP